MNTVENVIHDSIIRSQQELTDYLIMKLRTLATMRGAKPAEIQRNVESLETYEFPERVRVGLRDQYIDIPEKAPCGHFKGCECWKCY